MLFILKVTNMLNKEALVAIKDDFLEELKNYQEKVSRLPMNDWAYDGYDDSAYYANSINPKELKTQEITILQKYTMFSDYFEYLGIWEEVIKNVVKSTTHPLSKYEILEEYINNLYMASDTKIQKYIQDSRSQHIKDNLEKLDKFTNKTLSYAERIKKLLSPI